MDDVKAVFGSRLQQAREAEGLSLRKLQEALSGKVSHSQLAKYEKGVDMPSSEILMALCRTLDCSADQLFRPMHVGIDGIAFRKKSRWPKTKEKAVKALVQTGVDRYFELEELVGVPAEDLNPTGLTCRGPGDAEGVAEQVRETWALGEHPIANLVELLEDRHIKVQEVEADDQFDGCSGWGQAEDRRFPVVVLARWMDKDVARKRFSAAHELGHLVMDLSGLDNRTAEKACHRFAGAFLLPKEALFSHFGRHRSRVEWRELAMLKQEYGISMAAVLHRIHDLGIISDALAKRMSIERSQRGWRKHEPGAYAGVEEGFRFRQLLYRALAEEKISLTKAAELADEPVEGLQKELVVAGGAV